MQLTCGSSQTCLPSVSISAEQHDEVNSFLIFQMQHKHFNKILNDLQRRSSEPSHPASPLVYKHFKLIDSFYASDTPRDRDKIRVTRDEKTGNVIEVMKKMRLGDLNIYSPKRAADWRVSVSLEVPGRSSSVVA